MAQMLVGNHPMEACWALGVDFCTMNENEIPHRDKRASAPFQSQPIPLHRILVVDDDSSIRRMSTEALVRYGYSVDAAEDGAAAWDALNSKSYHLLITDNNMPKVSGVELLHKVHGARMGLPVIMATGTLPEVELPRSPLLQPPVILLKPYSIAMLLCMVRDVLQAAQCAREHLAIPTEWTGQSQIESCQV